MGGWPPDTLASDVLEKANAIARDLKLQISLQNAFVPGVRRGFVLIPMKPNSDESEEEMRQCAQACTRRENPAGVDLCTKRTAARRNSGWQSVSYPKSDDAPPLPGKSKGSSSSPAGFPPSRALSRNGRQVPCGLTATVSRPPPPRHPRGQPRPDAVGPISALSRVAWAWLRLRWGKSGSR